MHELRSGERLWDEEDALSWMGRLAARPPLKSTLSRVLPQGDSIVAQQFTRLCKRYLLRLMQNERLDAREDDFCLYPVAHAVKATHPSG